MRKVAFIALGLIALAAYVCCRAAGEVDRIERLERY